jgi:hypothetical protein
LADTFPRLSWLHPTRNATHRGVYHRAPTDSMLAWEAHPAGADDFDPEGRPLAEGAAVLVWLGGGACVTSVHDDIGAAKAHAEAALRMRGWL